MKNQIESFKIGDWKYLKSNNTLNFYSKDENGKRKYSYEIDLDRNITPNERYSSLSEHWLMHLSEKSSDNLSDDDIRDLAKCFIKLGYVVDLQKTEYYITRFNRK